MKKKKILLVGVTEIDSSTTLGIKAAFEQLGHDVTPFNYRVIAKEYDRKMGLIEKGCSKIRRLPLPSLIKRLYFFFPDRAAMNHTLLNTVANTQYDLVFLAKADSVDWKTIQKISATTPTWYFFMDPPSVAHGMQAHLYAKSATWGSATFKQVVTLFEKANPKSYWIIEGEDDTFYKNPTEKNKTNDVIFIGSQDARRTALIDFLLKQNIHVEWYGDGAPNPGIYTKNVVDVYHNSKIILNINRVGDGFSNRVLQALFSQSFLLSEYSSDLDNLFDISAHLQTYKTPKECAEKITYFLNHPEERLKIARDGQTYAYSKFTWKKNLEHLLKLTDPSFLIPLNTGIGNAVLLTPLIKTIKKNMPSSTITLICDSQKGIDKLFRDDPMVDRIIYEVDDFSYDIYFHTMLGSKKKWAFEVRKKNKKCTIITQYYKTHPPRLRERLFDALVGTYSVAINPNEHESLQYLSLLERFNLYADTTVSLQIKEVAYSIPLPKYYCVIQLGAAFNVPDNRNWPIENWKTLIEKLSEMITVVLVGSKNEDGLAELLPKKNIVNLIGKTELNELVGVLKNSQFFLGVDSGIGHISGALNHHTLILWGPTDFVKSHQVGEYTHFINLEKNCSPCRGPNQMGLWSGPESVRFCTFNQICMKEITAYKVYQKLRKLKWV